MKKRTSILLVLVLLLGGVTVYYFSTGTAETPAPTAKTLAHPVVATLSIRLPEEPCPATKPHKATKKADHPVALDGSMRAEIDYLNQSDGLPFQNNFHDGAAARKKTDHKFRRTANGFEVRMPSRSFMATPTYADGYLYTSGGFNSESFYAINVQTGKARWAVDLSDDGPSSAIVLDSTVIFNTESCTIFALDRFTGQQIWSKWIGDPLLTHPVSDGRLVFTSYPTYSLDKAKAAPLKHLVPSHPFVALDVRTGDVIWQRWLDGDVMTTPVVHGDDIYLTTFTGSMYRLAKADGKILAAADMQATSLPTIGKDHIYTTQRQMVEGQVNEAIVEVSKWDLHVTRTLLVHAAPYLDASVQLNSQYTKSCAAMDAQNGFLSAPEISGWRKASKLIGQSRISSLQNFVGSTVVLDGDRLYSSMGNRIVCLDIPTGDTVWSHTVKGDLAVEGGHLATIPMVCGPYVVSVTLQGDILVLDKAAGKLEKSYATQTKVRNQPIVVAGMVYVTSTDGRLTCIDTRDRMLDGWAMFLKNNAHDCSAN